MDAILARAKAIIGGLACSAGVFATQSLHCTLPNTSAEWGSIIAAFVIGGGLVHQIPNKQS
jgi:hypothetical protein